MKRKLDELDYRILDILIDHPDIPLTDIAKELSVSTGTIDLRLKKMRKTGLIGGSSLVLDYEKLGYGLTTYICILMKIPSLTQSVIKQLEAIPYVTIAQIITGEFDILCKIRSRNVVHAKEIVLKILGFEGVARGEAIYFIEESLNDKKRLMHAIFEKEI